MPSSLAAVGLQGAARAVLAPAGAGGRHSASTTWILSSPRGGRGSPRGLRFVTRASAGGRAAGNAIPVIVNGAAGRMGRAAVAAITKARGLELAGAIDVRQVGEDSGEVAGIDANEVPIFDDLLMVLASVAQGDRKLNSPPPTLRAGRAGGLLHPRCLPRGHEAGARFRHQGGGGDHGARPQDRGWAGRVLRQGFHRLRDGPHLLHRAGAHGEGRRGRRLPLRQLRGHRGDAGLPPGLPEPCRCPDCRVGVGPRADVQHARGRPDAPGGTCGGH
mmetsp:Transcript_10411/g.33644  ORF Transcript_10411/g.33644 Transcript_10411/m.33644 type:complete len:274 (+) Transcript_10411:124-945(+)